MLCVLICAFVAKMSITFKQAHGWQFAIRADLFHLSGGVKKHRGRKRKHGGTRPQKVANQGGRPLKLTLVR